MQEDGIQRVSTNIHRKALFPFVLCHCPFRTSAPEAVVVPQRRWHADESNVGIRSSPVACVAPEQEPQIDQNGTAIVDERKDGKVAGSSMTPLVSHLTPRVRSSQGAAAAASSSSPIDHAARTTEGGHDGDGEPEPRRGRRLSGGKEVMLLEDTPPVSPPVSITPTLTKDREAASGPSIAAKLHGIEIDPRKRSRSKGVSKFRTCFTHKTV